jgi:RNA recognition motif-containing protein
LAAHCVSDCSSRQKGIALKKLFIGNLPLNTTEEELEALFSEYGTVRSSKLVMDVFSGQCKGFGFIEMEGHEARAAIAGLNGKDFNGKPIKVNFESPKPGRRGR